MDDEETLETTEGDRAWREQMQETGEQAKTLQPPVPKHPEGAPSPNPPDPAPDS